MNEGERSAPGGMNLLVINFEMDSDSRVLAWQAQVVTGLASRFRRVVVLTNRVGRYAAPPNVRIVRFPRWLFRAPFRYFGGKNFVALQAGALILRERIDACFVHMNMEWCYRLSAAFRALRIPVVLWYAHGTVTPELHRALGAVSAVVTSTPEGFRIPSPKVRVIGQGIDTGLFPLRRDARRREDIVTVSRISRRKRLHLIVEAAAVFCRAHPDLQTRFIVIGEPLTEEDRVYAAELAAQVKELGLEGRVELRGGLNRASIAGATESAFVHVNLSETGSMDKTILEALATGCPVLTSNEAVFDLLSARPEMRVTDVSPKNVAARLWQMYELAPSHDPAAIRSLVEGHHDLENYCAKVTAEIVRSASDECSEVDANEAGAR